MYSCIIYLFYVYLNFSICCHLHFTVHNKTRKFQNQNFNFVSFVTFLCKTFNNCRTQRNRRKSQQNLSDTTLWALTHTDYLQIQYSLLVTLYFVPCAVLLHTLGELYYSDESAMLPNERHHYSFCSWRNYQNCNILHTSNYSSVRSPVISPFHW